MITLDTAVFDIHGDCVLALNWYKHLENKQAYIDSIGIHRAQYIQQFTVDAMHYVLEFGEDGFDMDALTDLWQRIRRKVNDHESSESIRCG